MNSKTMSETLHTCPDCGIPSFTSRGLGAHKCKGPKDGGTGVSPVLPSQVTTEAPRDPAWDAVRQTASQLRAVGRLWLRGQVRLGMQLAALKKQLGLTQGVRLTTSPDSGKVLSWADLVKQETGYSRQSCDEFIRLYEATVVKLKKSKKLQLPAGLSKDAIVLFQTENALALTDAQWTQVDELIGTLTTGETQASLMQELGVVAKPKPMPKKTGGKDEEEDEPTAGQLAFHFFSGVASPLINARTSPDYKAMLMALPVDSDADHPLSLSTLEAEFRAALAEVIEAKQANAKPAKGRSI